MALVGLSTAKSKLVVNLLPEVAELPHTLNTNHKVYWNDFIGKPFRARLGPRGKKSSNACTWTHNQFVGPFCDELYPKLVPEAREQYETILGPKVYSYLTNHSARGSTGVKAKAQTVKQRVYGHDIWRQENPQVFEEVLADYRAKNPNTVLNVGTCHSLTIDLFRKLPEGKQNKYYDKSEEAYLGARIKINSQVLYEDEDRDFHITTLVTNCMAELADLTKVDNLVARMQEWVKETASKGLLKDGTPAPTVYPDSLQKP